MGKIRLNAFPQGLPCVFRWPASSFIPALTKLQMHTANALSCHVLSRHPVQLLLHNRRARRVQIQSSCPAVDVRPCPPAASRSSEHDLKKEIPRGKLALNFIRDRNVLKVRMWTTAEPHNSFPLPKEAESGCNLDRPGRRKEKWRVSSFCSSHLAQFTQGQWRGILQDLFGKGHLSR